MATPSPTAPNGDALFALLDELRREGFSLGVGEYLNAQRTAAACYGDGKGDDPRRLCNYLAPVLCKNSEQQQLFHRRFDEWWVKRAGGRREDLELRPQPPSLNEELLKIVRPARPWKWQAAAVLGATVVVAALFWWPSIHGFGGYVAGLWRAWFVDGKLTVTTRSADGAALPGVQLVLSGRGGEVRGVTDNRGSARFNIPRGQYHLSSSFFGFAAGDRDVEVRRQPSEERLVLSALPRGELAGRVTDEQGRALPGVRILVGDRSAVLSDAMGGFELGSLPAGNYRVWAALRGFESASVVGGVVAGQRSVMQLEMAVIPLRVRVTDSNGRPLAGATVSSGSQSQVTSTDGIAELWHLTGRVGFLAEKSGFVSKTASALVSPGHTSEVAVALAGAASVLTVKVVDLADKPVSGTAVHLEIAVGKLATMRFQPGWAYSASLSPDSSRIVAASRDGTARIWSASGQLLAVLKGHSGWIYSASFSPDGSRVVTASEDGTARVWSAVTGRPVAILAGHKARVTTASFSPDGTRVVTGSEDETVRVWDVDTGKVIYVLISTPGAVTAASFSRDGTIILTAFSDGTVAHWSATGKLLGFTKISYLHRAIITSLSYSPDFQRLAFAETGTVRVLDASGRRITDLSGTTVSFSPDGTRLVIASDDRTASVWSVDDPTKPISSISDTLGVSHLRVEPLLPHTLLVTRSGYRSPPPFLLPENTLGGTLRAVLAPQTLWERLLPHQRKVRTALAVLPFVFAGPWFAWRRRSRRQLVLERRAVREEKATAPFFLPEPHHELYRGANFARTRVEVARRERISAGELDLDATVEATVRDLGFFTPIYRPRLDLPRYLVLIDRRNFRDQRGRMVDELLDRLEADGVQLDRYDFDRDPRRAAPRSGARSHRDLRALAGVYPHHRLAVFTDSAGFFDPASGRKAPWVELFAAWPRRALLTPVPVCHWRRREHDLKDAGFAVVPATETGVEWLANAWREDRGVVARPLDESWQPPYPDALATRPGRFLERNAPEEAELDELCGELVFYLGPHGYRWLCSLAVYPDLDWYFTLYLGLLLLRHDGRALLDEATLVAMTRLPWLRHGSMPDWLRVRLLRDLSKADETKVRRWLFDFLKKLEAPGGTFRLDIVRPPEPEALRLRERLRHWVENLDWQRVIKVWAREDPGEGPLRDQVFVSFMLGKKPTELQVLAPSAWRGWVWERGLSALGLRAGVILLLTILLSLHGLLLGGLYLKPLADHASHGRSFVEWEQKLAPFAPLASQTLTPAGPKPVTCGNDVADYRACHDHYPTGCSKVGKYDAALNELKNKLISPDSVPERFLTSSDFATLERATPTGLTSLNHQQFASQLRKLGEGSVVGLTGYLYYAEVGNRESSNCQLAGLDNIDFEIRVGFDTEADLAGPDPREHPLSPATHSVVVEMTPHWRGQFAPGWALPGLQAISGRQVRVVGQLLVDNEHFATNDDCSMIGARESTCSRLSAWELHPVTSFKVCDLESCDPNGSGWVDLESYRAKARVPVRLAFAGGPEIIIRGFGDAQTAVYVRTLDSSNQPTIADQPVQLTVDITDPTGGHRQLPVSVTAGSSQAAIPLKLSRLGTYTLRATSPSLSQAGPVTIQFLVDWVLTVAFWLGWTSGNFLRFMSPLYLRRRSSWRFILIRAAVIGTLNAVLALFLLVKLSSRFGLGAWLNSTMHPSAFPVLSVLGVLIGFLFEAGFDRLFRLTVPKVVAKTEMSWQQPSGFRRILHDAIDAFLEAGLDRLSRLTVPKAATKTKMSQKWPSERREVLGISNAILVKYALGVTGVASAIALVYSIGISPKLALMGTAVILALMANLVLFARLASLSKGPSLPALFMTWLSLLLLIVVSALLVSDVFFRKPFDLSRWLDGVKLYAVRVQVLGPQGRPAAGSRIIVSTGDVPHLLPDGSWEVQIPRAKVPTDGRIFLSVNDDQREVYRVALRLAEDPKPKVEIHLKVWATGDYKTSFQQGFQAIDRKRYSEAVGKMRDAIRQRPAEGGDTVKISGSFFSPYLPHYYLGVALYYLNDCAGALTEWRESERQGVIAGTSEAGMLRILKAKCGFDLPRPSG